MRFVYWLCPCFNKRIKTNASSSFDTQQHPQQSDDVASTWELFFELHSLQLATNFFSELNQLGHGGFGPVYRVSFLSSDFFLRFIYLQFHNPWDLFEVGFSVFCFSMLAFAVLVFLRNKHINWCPKNTYKLITQFLKIEVTPFSL